MVTSTLPGATPPSLATAAEPVSQAAEQQAPQPKGDPHGRGVNLSKPERIASLAGGGALALLGLSRRSKTGVALALAGAPLLHRGATGHCYGYQLMGKSTAPHQGDTRSTPRL